MTRKQLEKKYGVKIADDSFYNYRTGKFCKQYRLYSADGCPWEKGLLTLKAVERECKEWEKALLDIKNKQTKRGVGEKGVMK